MTGQLETGPGPDRGQASLLRRESRLSIFYRILCDSTQRVALLAPENVPNC